MKKTEIGIITAMDLELENIVNAMTDTETTEISGMRFVTGILGGKRVVGARCGIGKVFAAVCAQTMILGFSPDVILNVGVAGALAEGLTIGEIVIAENAVQHDMDTTALGDERGLVSGLDIVKIPTDAHVNKVLEGVVKDLGINYEVGTIATGDTFVSTNEMKKFLTDSFGAAACEMEGAAVALACYINRVPCSILRAMSDGGDDNSHMDYPTFAKMAAKNSAKVFCRFAEVWGK